MVVSRMSHIEFKTNSRAIHEGFIMNISVILEEFIIDSGRFHSISLNDLIQVYVEFLKKKSLNINEGYY